MKKHFISMAMFSLMLVVFGKSIHHIGIAILLGIGIFDVVKSKRFYKPKFNYSGYLFGLFLVVAVITSYFGINSAHSFEKFWEIIGWVIVYMIFLQIFDGFDTKRAKDYSRFVVKVLPFFAILLILIHSGIASETIEVIFHKTYKSYYGLVIALFMPFLFIEFLRVKDRDQEKILSLISLFICLIALVISNSRSAWLGLFIGSGFFATLYPWKSWKQLAKIALFGAACLILGLVFYIEINGAEHMAARLGAETFKGGRGPIWKYAIDNFMDNMWFGMGLSSYSELDFTGVVVDATNHPHNFIIEILMDTGIIGFLCFFGAIVLGFRRFVRGYLANGKRDIFALSAASSVMIYFATMLTMTSMYRSWSLPFLIIFMAIANRARVKHLIEN